MSDVRIASRIAFPSLADATPERRAEQAEARGHAAGYAAGIRAAHAETEALRASLESALTERLLVLDQVTAARTAALDHAIAALTARTAPVLQDAEDVMVAAAMELAEAVVGHEIAREARDGSGARSALARALASVDTELVVAVRLSPADAAALSAEALGGATSGTATPGTALPVRIVADASLAPGDAIADLPNGSVDARVGAALERARTALGLHTGGDA